MKITIVMGFFLPVPALAGGATEKIWHRLGELMADAGHEVLIISRRWPKLANQESHGNLTHLRIPGMNHTRFLVSNLLLDLLWGFKVMRALPAGDIVICNTVTLPIFLRWLKPSSGHVAAVLGRMPKGQIRAYSNVDLLLATSTAVADEARRENPKISSRIFKFPNPADWHLHANASTQGAVPGGPVVIGYIGRIHPEKGLEQLLAAAINLTRHQDLPAWEVRLIGPVAVGQGGGGEEYRDSLEQEYSSALGARLRFVPPVFDNGALAQLYGELDVFCYPSLAAKGEGLSIAPIEAMSAGAVPVVSKLDCYRDLIIPEENGFQFDQTKPDAVEVLTEILQRLLENPDLRQRCAEQAQNTARRFDYSETACQLLTEFDKRVSP